MARMAGAVLAALLIAWAGSGVAQPAMRRGLDTTETFYDVQGTDHRSVLAALNARGPKGYHAFAEWKVSYTYWTATRGGKCAVERVETTMSGSVIMPRWATRDKAPSSLVSHWDRYHANLRTHEEGHLDHGRELARLLKSELPAVPAAATCPALEQAVRARFDTLLKRYQDRDVEYDRRTEHGKTQGAWF